MLAIPKHNKLTNGTVPCLYNSAIIPTLFFMKNKFLTAKISYQLTYLVLLSCKSSMIALLNEITKSTNQIHKLSASGTGLKRIHKSSLLANYFCCFETFVCFDC